MRTLTVRSVPLLAVVSVALAFSGCGDREGSEVGHLGTYHGDRSLAPEEVAREYVEALDERDGQRFCELIAPYISGRYDLVAKDPNGFFRGKDGCPELASAFIGYVEDCCPDRFEGATVDRILAVEEHGELRKVRVRITLDLDQMSAPSGPKLETIEDTVWLARFDGSWRVAKLSAVARAASLSDTRFDEEPAVPGDDDPAAMPDLEAERRAFAAQVDRFRGLRSEHEGSYAEPGEARSCDGGISVDDPEGDQGWNGGGSGQAPAVPVGDLAGVDVELEGDSVCVRWRLLGKPDGALALSYNHRNGPSDGQGFDIEIRSDGMARATSGEDNEGRRIPVRAEIGIDEAAVSAVITPDPRPPGNVGFSAAVFTSAGDHESVSDYLGGSPSTTFRYSDGGECPLSGC